MQLSRRFERLWQNLDEVPRRLELGHLAFDPFAGALFPGQTLFREILDLPVGTPLRGALAEHVRALVEERVQWPWTVRRLVLGVVQRTWLEEPERAELSLREIRQRALLARGPTFAAYDRARFAPEAELGRLEVEVRQRSSEIERLMEVPNPARPPTPDKAVALAHHLLSMSGEVLMELGLKDENDLTALLLSDAAEGWPARLEPRGLYELISGPRWLSGVSLDRTLLPKRVLPTSFLLALDRLGVQIHRGLERTDLPFVVRRRPYDGQARAAGALLASLPLALPFLRRRLGLSAERADRTRRALKLACLAELRRRAGRFLLAEAALEGRARAEDRAAELGAACFGRELLPEVVLGRLLGPGPDFLPLQAFVGGGLLHLRLRAEFDEDWFESPRALEWLREEWAQPLSGTAPLAEFDAAAVAPLLEELAPRS